MVRKFNVKVNGKEYLVEVEEIGTVQPTVVQQTEKIQPVVQQTVASAVEQPKQTQKVEAPKPEPKPAPVSSGGHKIVAPMSGLILKVLVVEGQQVTKTTKVAILEAMKMENDILAGVDGTIKKVYVKDGDNVEVGQVLMEV